MMAMFRPWWRDRSERERWLIGIMAAMLIGVAGWLGVVRPVAAARDAAIARHDAAVAGLDAVQAMTGAIRRAEQRGAAARSVPLVELVSRRVAEAGLSSEAMATTGDGRVTMRIAAVRPAVVLRWLAEIEAKDAIIVERAGMTRNSDATVAVELSLRSGGG